jgi:hypothetical protein
MIFIPQMNSRHDTGIDSLNFYYISLIRFGKQLPSLSREFVGRKFLASIKTSYPTSTMKMETAGILVMQKPRGESTSPTKA